MALASAGTFVLDSTLPKNPYGGTNAGGDYLTDHPGYGGNPDYQNGLYDYQNNPWQYGGGAISDGDFAASSGTVTYKCKWQPAYTKEPAPERVVVHKQVRCYARFGFSYNIILLNTALGGTPTYTTYSNGLDTATGWLRTRRSTRSSPSAATPSP